MLSDDFLNQVFDPEQSLTLKLVSLSKLSEEEVERFGSRWERQPADVRASLLDRLTTLAEDNPETNFDAIFRRALADGEPELRVKAIDALWECRERWLLHALVGLAEDDLEPEVRAAAAGHLERFVILGAQEELRPSLLEKVESALRRILSNPREDSPVRRRALEALSSGEGDDVDDLIRDAYHSRDHEMKLGAIYAMGQHYDSAWLPALLAELKSPDAETRYEAARACGALEDSRAVPGLAELIKGPDVDIQEAAITSLGQIGGADAKRLLSACLASGSTRVQDAAKAALEELAFGEDPMTGGLR
jgi:HEAT repeat protein